MPMPTETQMAADVLVECQFCENKIEPWHLVCKPCWQRGCRSSVSTPTLSDAALRAEMKRLQREWLRRRGDVPDEPEHVSDGVARAVAGLQERDWFLGAARFMP